MLLMSLVGACVAGVTLGVATFYCYGIGIYLGLPVGLLVGGFFGWKMALRDACVISGTAVLSFLGFRYLVGGFGWDSFWVGVAASVLASACTIASYGIIRVIAPRIRYAVACWICGVAAAWTVWAIVSFMMRPL